MTFNDLLKKIKTMEGNWVYYGMSADDNGLPKPSVFSHSVREEQEFVYDNALNHIMSQNIWFVELSPERYLEYQLRFG